jgi:hypothetical protein
MTNADAEPPTLRMTLFDGALSQRGYRINKFAKSLTTVPGREAFHADPRGTMAGFGLTGAEMDLAKIAIAQGGTLLDIGAQMRGQSQAEFMAALRTERDRRKDRA